MSEEEEPSPVSSLSDLSEFKKGQIVGAYLGGLSVKDVSRMCNVSCHTVSEILDVYKLYLELTPGLKRKSGAGTAMKMRKRLRNGETEETRGTERKETDTKKSGIENKAQPDNEDRKEK